MVVLTGTVTRVAYILWMLHLLHASQSLHFGSQNNIAGMLYYISSKSTLVPVQLFLLFTFLGIIVTVTRNPCMCYMPTGYVIEDDDDIISSGSN